MTRPREYLEAIINRLKTFNLKLKEQMQEQLDNGYISAQLADVYTDTIDMNNAEIRDLKQKLKELL